MSDEHERYFPNHKIELEIGLAEYNLAAQKLQSEDNALTWSTNTTIILATAVGFAAFRLGEYKNGLANAGFSILSTKTAFLILTMILSIMAIIHISNLLKSRVFSERKIVVLRRILGVSYGENTLVLPNWRVEGADNPFSIHLFPGLFSYRAFPVHIILTAMFGSIILLAKEPLNAFLPLVTGQPLEVTWQPFLGATAFYLLGLSIFTHQLNDTNVNWRLRFTKVIARFLAVPLAGNFEYTIYRIRLTVAEAKRIKADFVEIKRVAILIEDQQFRTHNGINWRGIARAAKNLVWDKRRTGGSSITQQFVRSNFILNLRPTIGRKFVEMMLAKWIETVWTKEEILEGYLVTARFERNIYGFHNAYKHFFEDHPAKIKPWEAFILIERLGNIHQRFLGRRVRELLLKFLGTGDISKQDSINALNFYDGFQELHFEVLAGETSASDVLKEIEQ